MKRVFAILVVIILCVTILIVPVLGAGSIYVVAIDEKLFPIRQSNTPVMHKGSFYLPQAFWINSGLGITSSYNKTDSILTLSKSGYSLSFNLDTGFAFDSESVYSRTAVEFSGAIYVPAQFVCSRFGLGYNYYENLGVIRIITQKSQTGSATFEALVKNKVNQMREEYKSNNSTNNSSGQTTKNSFPPSDKPSGEPTPSPTAVIRDKTIFFTFNDGPSTGKVLDILEANDLKAAIFLDSSQILSKADMVRRIYGSGNVIGILGNAGKDDVAKDLVRTDEEISRMIFTKTRMARVRGGVSKESADNLILAGFRIWDYNIDGNVGRSNQVIDGLKTLESAAVISFDCDDDTVRILPEVIRFIKNDEYVVKIANENASPYNWRHELR